MTDQYSNNTDRYNSNRDRMVDNNGDSSYNSGKEGNVEVYQRKWQWATP